MVSLLTVTSDPLGDKGIMSLDVDEVVYITTNPKIKDGLIVHTADNEFYMVGTLKYWTSVLNSSGYRFSIVDRSNASNIDKIVWLDGFYKVAYFSQEVTAESKKCTIAYHRYDKVASELTLFNPKIAMVR